MAGAGAGHLGVHLRLLLLESKLRVDELHDVVHRPLLDALIVAALHVGGLPGATDQASPSPVKMLHAMSGAARQTTPELRRFLMIQTFDCMIARSKLPWSALWKRPRCSPLQLQPTRKPAPCFAFIEPTRTKLWRWPQSVCSCTSQPCRSTRCACGLRAHPGDAPTALPLRRTHASLPHARNQRIHTVGPRSSRLTEADSAPAVPARVLAAARASSVLDQRSVRRLASICRLVSGQHHVVPSWSADERLEAESV